MTGTSLSRTTTGPMWTTWLGIVAVLFGTLFAAAQSNELLVQTIIAPGTAADRNMPIECRKDEAAEEGLSVAECELMVANVRIMLESRPPWFRRAQSSLALAGALVSFFSILVGVALVDARAWGPGAAVWTFALLVVLDAAGFSIALYTGPLLRAAYLWSTLLWFFIHLCMASGVIVGRQVRLPGVDVQSAPA